MRGRIALCTEIVGSLDQSAAEELLPDAVDLHSGGQRIAFRRDPLSQSQP